MRNSSNAILTTHAGRLPIPPGCEDLPTRIFSGQPVDDAQIEQAIADTVRRQADIGVDCIGDIPKTHWNPDDYFDSDPKSPDMTYARRGGFLDAIDFNPMEFAPRVNSAAASSE